MNAFNGLLNADRDGSYIMLVIIKVFLRVLYCLPAGVDDKYQHCLHEGELDSSVDCDGLVLSMVRLGF